MHMADALLSPAVGATFWAATLGTIGFVSKKLRERLDEKMVPLMGVLGAFIFAAQMINFTIPGTGSSGHLGGGMILAIILGPHAGFLVMASVLTVQSLFFADGGLLALGCNIWNLGVYPCFVAYPLIYRPLVRPGSTARRISLASLASGVVALQLGAFSVVVQTFLSGRTELPPATFLLLMQPIHLAIGIVEGLSTAGVINFVLAARPEILESSFSSRPLASGIRLRAIGVLFLVLSLGTAGALSWFASTNPDGLEWAVEKVLGKSSLPEQDNGVAGALKSLQEKTALFPDYATRERKEEENAATPAGRDSTPSVPGITGAAIVLAAVFLTGLVIRLFRRKR